MSAIAQHLLFCEGGPPSDARLFSALAPGWTVIPSGSRDGIRRFAEGRLLANTSALAVIVRDRDFDGHPSDPPAPMRVRGAPPFELCLSRATLESYLYLDAPIVHAAWVRSHQRLLDARRPSKTPPSVPEIEEALRSAARDLRAFQAARWALQSWAPRIHRLKNSWLGPSGNLPAPGDRTEGAIRRQMIDYSGAWLKQMDAAKPDLHGLHLLFEAYLDRFDDTFFVHGHWRSWFQGKDVLKALRQQNQQWTLPRSDALVDACIAQPAPDLGALRDLLAELRATPASAPQLLDAVPPLDTPLRNGAGG